jgi:hypothetical protein
LVEFSIWVVGTVIDEADTAERQGEITKVVGQPGKRVSCDHYARGFGWRAA